MGNADQLREPKTAFQSLIRRLAEEAMSVTNHTTSEHEPEYAHEVRAMERRFAVLVRAHLAARTRTARRDGPEAMREAAARVCDQRATYFAAAKGYREWTDAVRSYSATADEIRALPLPQEPSR